MSQQAILNVIKQTADKWQKEKGEKPKREPFFMLKVMSNLERNGVSPTGSYHDIQNALDNFFK